MNRKEYKYVAVFMAFNILAQVSFPTIAYGLTGGPSQPEIQSFEPIGTTEMVDLFSGDFTYNIPLLDIEGYPINIAYHSGITADQEASWVGLGWNINPGAINRNMRGLPDDFNGTEEVKKDMYIKPNFTYGMSFGKKFEWLSIETAKLKKSASLSFGLGIFYNNYRGVGFEQSISPSISAGNKLKGSIGLSLSGNTQSGADISPSTNISLSTNLALKENHYGNAGIKIGVKSSFNSRSGMKTTSFSKSITYEGIHRFKVNNKDKELVGRIGAANNVSYISGGSQSYVPQISMPMRNVNVSFNFQFGPYANTLEKSTSISGYYSRQAIDKDEKTQKRKAYGYLHSDLANKDMQAMHDLNRENDGSYSKHNPNLPITTYTYDIYAVNGQGIGGMFRPYRSDIGQVYDSRTTSDGNGGSGGFGISVGNATKWSADVNYNWSWSESQRWAADDGNGLDNTFNFRTKDISIPNLNEVVYFKTVGEKNQVEKEFFPYMNLNDAVRPAFATTRSVTTLLTEKLTSEIRPDILIKNDGSELRNASNANIVNVSNSNLSKKRRDYRNHPIQYLTVAEKNACLDKDMPSYPLNGFNTSGSSVVPTLINREDTRRKPNHITEVTALNASGDRYVYGIAAYNNSQEEITFSVKKYLNGNECKSLTKYEPSFYNEKQGEATGGHDAYYSGTTLPSYAHSYLLTAVLSPDYVDVDNNGISENDLGNYTKINYTRAQSDYKWRTPYPDPDFIPTATLNKGLKSDDFDNKGSIVYGSKEIWYVHSIESKNYIAEFTLSAREDGKGVADVHGGTGAQLYRLDKITLYSKLDKTTPIKTVHFKYEYKLCQNTPNSSATNGAKLTLTEIYFTYGNSNKGKLSRYKFDYNETAQGVYENMAYDRWGNYKPNVCGTRENGVKYPNNIDYPYTIQDPALADKYAKEWTLNKISLPSGGTINIEYEADDYAYVQDKKAMQMFEVAGFSEYGTVATPYLYSETQPRANHYVHVKLNEACATVEDFIKYYLPAPAYTRSDGARFLYFNVLTKINDDKYPNKEEYVSGYAEIEDINAAGTIKKIDGNGLQYAIKLKSVKSGNTIGSSYDPDASAIAIAALQMYRLSLPQYVYPGSDQKKTDEAGALAVRSLFGVFFDLIEVIQGINDKLLRKEYARKCIPELSWVRLNNGNGKKKGGGVRVKKIELNDNWNSMNSNGISASYGQEYFYTTQDEYKRTISSGVASYEPMIGNDENPWRQPVMSNKENSLIPDEQFYAEAPFGESYFPAPSVGYSKVTVRNLKHTNVKKHATGEVVHEFYTTKDFPTLVSRTNTQANVIKPNWLTGLFSLKSFNEVSAAQGYRIELNDMNGKPKAQWVYAESEGTAEKSIVSGTEYIYKTDANNSKHLNNEVRVVQPNGAMDPNPTTLVGVDADMILDTRVNYNTTTSVGVSVNMEFFIAGIFPFLIPIPLPSYSKSVDRFRSAVITRAIQRYGILEKTIVHQEKATITTENYAFDAKTGNVLLTKTQNEYEDPIYNAVFPAHWTYDGMGMAADNVGAEVIYSLNNDVLMNGLYRDELENNFFKPGDEVLLYNPSNPSNPVKYWIKKDGTRLSFVGAGASSSLTGATLNARIKIVRSGKRNQQNTPVQNITSSRIPSFVLTTNQARVLTSNASIFNDRWPTMCIITNASAGDVSVAKDIMERANEINDLIKVINDLLPTINWTSPAFQSSPESALMDRMTVSPITISNSNSALVRQGFINSFWVERTKLTPLPGIASNQIKLTFYFPMPNCRGESSGYKFEMQTYGTLAGNNNQIGDRATFFTSNSFSNIQLLMPTYISGNTFNVGLGINQPPISSGRDFGSAHITLDECGEVCSYGAGCAINNPDNSQFNPYLTGHQGIWRKKRDYLHLTNRQTVTASVQNTRYDGFYTSYAMFWKYDAGKSKWVYSEDNWVWSNDVVNVLPAGMEIENKDKLDRYTSALFYSNKLPSALASNAQRREIGFLGFEQDQDLSTTSCFDHHWVFKKSGTITFDNIVSHSGMRSLKLLPGQVVNNFYYVNQCRPSINENGSINKCPELTCNDCILPFNPFQGKQYVLSGWVHKAGVSNIDQLGVNDNCVSVVLKNGGVNRTDVTINISPKGMVIDGWQKFEEVITIPVNSTAISVTLKASTASTITYYDDIRIHPLNASMKSYVYHPTTLKLMAEHDENNYATFYEYDEEGQLKRVKKETERGILTVKETRNHITK